MSALVKFIVVPVAGLGGTAGTVYVGSKLANFSGVDVEDDSIVETIKDKFVGRLITSKSDNPKWKSRLSKLQKAKKDELDEDLKNVKSEQELKAWCDDVAIKPFESETNIKVKGVQEYCVLYIRDQVLGSHKLLEKTGTWDGANGRLKGSTGKLSKEMEEVKKKLETEANALKEWCTSKYELPFKDKKDLLLADVSKFCTELKPKAVKPVASAETKPK
ncbi:hypothetical protein HF1_07360 [Mycoplasma haemofelis str. Langford 1]|uniref:Uncharacterized protein n=1 Tax=Mycoplasma haemofelis (strain Langford 1) TaxID=941640 RepID=E8ZHX3_MYCHL|nr:hypothetical protein [Mycoplasma haemofelis]CBY92744.1 hypothetical protein HF1_07360 [Mycoplasma haemofelis str. Langford 1]